MTHPHRKSLLSVALLGATVLVAGLAPRAALAEGSIVVNDLTLTRGISEREPMDKVDAFSVNDSKAVAFARIKNDGPPTTVNFVWHYGDEEHGSVSMNIGTSGGWRTWSSANLRPGNWRVEIHDSNGMMLMSKAFTVGATTAQSPMEQDATSAATMTPSTSDDYGMGENTEPMNATSQFGTTGQ